MCSIIYLALGVVKWVNGWMEGQDIESLLMSFRGTNRQICVQKWVLIASF